MKTITIDSQDALTAVEGAGSTYTRIWIAPAQLDRQRAELAADIAAAPQATRDRIAEIVAAEKIRTATAPTGR